ncbi:pyridoxal phosphate-dependent aminotransferase [bacterium]|nr:pyridoxal phosphate-dependent aminotransferase [bacterium]
MSRPEISSRGLETPASPIRKLTPYADEAKSRGVRVYHLNIGQPDIHTPREFFEAVKGFDGNVLSYNPSNGIPAMLESLEQYYHRCGLSHVTRKDIMVTTAGSEAILFSMMAVTSPGDEIIVFEPFYPNYNGFAKMAGVTLVPIASDPRNGYRLPDRETIESRITPKTRAILICSPNNPTGTVLTAAEMGIIKDLALEHGLFVLSDEVYREFVFEGSAVSILSFPELSEHAVICDSLSKRYSACGARIGSIVSKNAAVMETVLKFGQARLCPPTLEQIGSAAVVNTGSKYFKGMLDEYRKRRDVLYEGLLSIPGVMVKKPGGAFYMMVSFPVDDIEDFCRWLLSDFELEHETTMLAPGPGFYATKGKGKQEARIAYVLNVEDMKKAINVLSHGLSAYQSTS